MGYLTNPLRKEGNYFSAWFMGTDCYEPGGSEKQMHTFKQQKKPELSKHMCFVDFSD